MGSFLMPSLGADMEHGTVLEWKVRPGDIVHRGDIVAVVDTDKADIDVEVFEDGRIEKLLVEVGRQVPVGAVLATITPLGAPGPAAAPAPEPVPGRVPSSPYARRRAAALGVDLAAIQGSGPDGAVVARDLEPAGPSPGTESAVISSRRANVAALMARSKREIPHYYLSSVVDLGPTMEWLRTANSARPAPKRVLPAAVLLTAVARAAVEVPTMNGHWIDGGFHPSATVDLGVAVALRGEGLVAPVIADVATLTVDQLMDRLRALTQRVRRGGLRGSDLSPPSITVTNLGDQGADAVLGVIYPPQVALVGAGRVVDRVLAVGGRPVVRPAVTLTLAGDHRASDGHDGSRFLAAVAAHLAEPAGLS